MRAVLVRLSALGDVVHTWPLVHELRAQGLVDELVWVVEAPLQALVEGHPAVDEVIPVATRSWRRRPLAAATRAEVGALRRRLRGLDADLCLDPQGVLKSALVAHATRAPRRVGLARPWRRERLAGLTYTETVPGVASARHVVATNLELLRAAGGKPPEATPAPDGRWLLERARQTSVAAPSATRYAALLAGAGGAAKVVPTATLVGVARGLADLGLTTVVVWGPGERERAAVVAERATAELAPQTSLLQLTLLLGRARLVVGGDTGPVHLAASLGVPTVAAFLTTDWRRNGPLGPAVRVVSAAAEGDARPSGSARTRQLRELAADEILAAAAALLPAK